MVNIDPDKKLRAPVLDRLLDDTPDERQEDTAAIAHQVLGQLQESIRRDLENLLNTRFRCLSIPDQFPTLQQSILNYGLPDLSTFNLATNTGRKELCKKVEESIHRADPRITKVKVTSDSKFDENEPFIRFRVEAKVHADPSPVLLVFDSALNPVSYSIDVNGNNE